MDLQQVLRNDHSKAGIDKVIRWVGDSQLRFDELFNLFTGQDNRLAQVSGWPVSYCTAAHPGFIGKHWKKLLANLDRPGIHDAIKRNTYRLLQDVPIPEKYQGEVMNRCFESILAPAEKPAIKAFALTVLDNLSSKWPEIRNELKTSIETLWEYESPAFRARARKILAGRPSR
ncbi:MAG: hypothetical protein EOO09_19230 [Chitinophagaceae bacterium]|nr:MAG: hypothetical protein EOO09_19230 [Chitinophagaceae bacterium]